MPSPTEAAHSPTDDKPDDKLDKKTFDAIQEEAADRLADARRQKWPFEMDMREAYWFAAPHRARSVLSSTKLDEVKPRDDGELNMSFAYELAGDFPTVMINTFLPEAQPWAVRKAGWAVPEASKGQIEKDASDGTSTIFQAISSTNFYAECGKSFTPDLALGTVAMWIEPGPPAHPIKNQAIPIRELEINVSPWGEVDDRFVVRWTRARYVERILRDMDLPPKVKKRIKSDPKERIQVTWGFWRIHDDTGEEIWQHVVMVDDLLVNHTVIRGAGCCPLIVARFNPSPEWAWGVGPLLQSLPDLRHLDELARAKIRNLELSLNPPISFPDDSFVNIEEGLEPGMGYPIRPGTAGDIKNIYTPNAPDAAIYDRQDLEQRLKRLFFLDWPEQRGETPPTATQWLDQMTMAQRRIGTPGLTFWAEFCGGVFLRYQYLLEKAGIIKPVTINGKVATLQPYNPAQKAAEQQDVAQAARFISIVGPAFPEEFKVAVDGTATIGSFIKLMGVEDVIKMRKPDDVKNALSQIQQLQQGTPSTAPAVPTQGAPTPQPDLAGAAPAPTNVQIRGKM